MQTNAAQFEKQSVLQIVKSEGWGLYRGASWTAARVNLISFYFRMHLDHLRFLELRLQLKNMDLDYRIFTRPDFLKILLHLLEVLLQVLHYLLLYYKVFNSLVGRDKNQNSVKVCRSGPGRMDYSSKYDCSRRLFILFQRIDSKASSCWTKVDI